MSRDGQRRFAAVVRPAWPALPVAVACAAFVLAALPGWAWLTPEGELRILLSRWQFWAFELQFALVAAASLHQLPRAAAAARGSGAVWATVAGSCLLCLVLAAAVAPRTSRIFFDEQIYQAAGRSLADARLAQMCNDGTVEYGRLQCWSAEYNKQPYAYPYVLGLAYRVLGPSPDAAHAVNNVAAAALVPVVFLLTALALRRAAAAAWAALVMALVPMHLVWGNTAAAEPTAALACATAVLSAFWFVRARSTPALVWCGSVTVFAASFRPECLLVVPLVLVIVLVSAPGELWRARAWWSLAGFALLGWNVIAHAFAVRHEAWGAQGARLSWDFATRNVGTNGLFYVWDERFPALFTVLAALGLAAGRRIGATWMVATYFVLFWGVFLFFYAGSYDYGADVRYSLMTYAPLAVLAGAGAATVVRKVETFLGARMAVRACAGLLLFHASLYVPLIRSVGEEAWAARADVAFIDRQVERLPPNAVVLTHTPSTLFLRDVNAAQASLATTNPRRVAELFDRYAGGVYLLWGFWCNVDDPLQQSFCSTALAEFDNELVAEERVRNYRFAMYRLSPRRSR